MLPAFLALQQIDTRLVEHMFRARNEVACQKFIDGVSREIPVLCDIKRLNTMPQGRGSEG